MRFILSQAALQRRFMTTSCMKRSRNTLLCWRGWAGGIVASGREQFLDLLQQPLCSLLFASLTV